MKRKVLAMLMAVAVAMTVLPTGARAQKKGGSEADDYNLQKAMEVLQKDSRDTDTALELLNKQLQITPDNVEALVLRGRINLANDNCSLALTDFNHAIRVNKPKTSGYFNSTLWWWKANVYRQSDDYELAEVNMAKAVELCRKDNKDNLINALSNYAQILYVNDKLDEADAAYREILKIDDGKVEAMVGLARNQTKRGNYDDAISTLEKCRQLSPGYADIELYEALAYDGKGETDKAIDRVVELIDMDFERVDEDMMNILWKHTSYAIARMRSAVRKSESPECLKFMIAISLEHDKEYEDATIGYMKVQAEYGGNWGERISDCMEELGLYNEALTHIDSYLKEDPDDHSALMAKGRLLRALGMYDEALQNYGKIVDIAPDHSSGYYYKARCFEAMGEYDKALKMYDTCIDITKGDRYDFIMRGKLREKMGDSKGAEEDFRMVLQIDTTANDSSGRMYALHFLGKDDEAMEWMQKVIDGNPDDGGVWYDKACLLCLMSQPDEAVEALREALDKGFIDFWLIRTDNDLDLIRERDDFKTMVYDYRL